MIVYFTGTGNSRWCAELMADHLQDEVLDSFGYIRNGIAAELISGRPWVFVCPTYAYRIPRIFEQFIRTGSFNGEKEAYFVLTCGSGVGGAGAFLEELCRSVGLRYMGTLEVVMPENYIAMFPVPDEERSAGIFERARPVLLEGVYRIKQKEPFGALKVGSVSRLKSKMVNIVFYDRFIKDGPFRVSDKCIGCGKCSETCVLNNIVMEGGKPVWKGNCTHCMACICGCPVEAIDYGRATKGKRRYQAPKYR